MESHRRSNHDRGLPERIRAVVFDLDDTLVTSTVNYGKFKSLVIDRIVSYGEDRSSYSHAETVVSIISRYEKRLREGGAAEGEIRSRLSELDRIMDEVELERVHETVPIEGAAGLLRTIRAKGVKVGVLTRGCQAYAGSALSVSGLADLVDAMECRNSDTKPKPDPESYLRLVEALGVRKEETVFVGDHLIDAKCASNAGVPFIGVLTGDVPEDELLRGGSVRVFRDAGEMASWLEESLR
jgi:phosphoglycolate phosphatase